MIPVHEIETVELASLRPHPRNYRTHPDDQIAHLCTSITEYGLYRNIAVARDGTILAGHGVVQACAKLGLQEVDVVRLDLDPEEPRALKLVTADNEVGHLAEINDRLLSELLREVKDSEVGLLGTGYDEAMLANLVMVTRDANEIQSLNEAAEWVGMPEYKPPEKRIQMILNFETEEDRNKLIEQLHLRARVTRGGGRPVAWWPPKPDEDLRNVAFEEQDG